MATIDISRAFEYRATCPTCGLVRSLPLNWQQLMHQAWLDEHGPAAEPWDGVFRCRNGHPQTPMDVVEVRNYEAPQPDGSYVVHLVEADDHPHRLCTGQPWAGLPPNLPAGTKLRFCAYCQRFAFAHAGR